MGNIRGLSLCLLVGFYRQSSTVDEHILGNYVTLIWVEKGDGLCYDTVDRNESGEILTQGLRQTRSLRLK